MNSIENRPFTTTKKSIEQLVMALPEKLRDTLLRAIQLLKSGNKQEATQVLIDAAQPVQNPQDRLQDNQISSLPLSEPKANELDLPSSKYKIIDKEENRSLADLLGQKALSFLSSQGTNIYKFDAEENSYAAIMRPELSQDLIVPFGSRSMIITRISNDQDSRLIQLSFAFTNDVIKASEQSLLEFRSEGNTRFLRQEQALQAETLAFLRFCRSFINNIDEKCEILLKPADEQREKLYRKALAGKANIKFV